MVDKERLDAPNQDKPVEGANESGNDSNEDGAEEGEEEMEP